MKKKDYFVAEIKERKLMSKRISEYIASFDYFDKSLIVLSVTTSSISIASLATVIRAAVGIAGVIFSLKFQIFTGIVKTLFKKTRNKNKKRKRKLNSIESKISEALINNKINYEDFTTVINEEKKYRELK